MARKKSAALTSRTGSVLLIGNASDAISTDNPDEACNTETREIVPHPEFFLDNTLIAIQIENTLFNVHKYQLAKSEVFSEMFQAPKADGDEPEAGSSPEHPIVIKGATASDFAALLKVLYARHFSGDQHTPNTPLIIPAFRLANLLEFSELRTFLLPLAERNLGDIDKIIFAREFNIKSWLAPAHIRLCQRPGILSTQEARKLGVDSVLMISRMREQHRGQNSCTAVVNGYYCYTCLGATYVGNCGYTCQHCNNTSNVYMRYDGPGKLSTSSGIKTAAIETEVKKWVEDNYSEKD